DGIPPSADPEFKEPGHDPYARNLNAKDIRRIVTAMETVREQLGPDIDFAVEAHWRYDVRDVINLANALEHVKPMWLEDPVPPDNPEAMARVTHAVDVPICTGENLYGRHGFRKLIELQACDAIHIDIPKAGALLEAKRIAGLQDRKSTRLNSSHVKISYAVFCLKKKKARTSMRSPCPSPPCG